MESQNVRLNYLSSISDRLSYLMVVAGPILLGLSAWRLISSSFYLVPVIIHAFFVLFSVLIHFKIIKTTIVQKTTFYIVAFSVIGFVALYVNKGVPHGMWMFTISMSYCSLVYNRLQTTLYLIFNILIIIGIALFFEFKFTFLEILAPSVFIYFIIDAFGVAKNHIVLNAENVSKLNKELNLIVTSRNQFFANLTHELRTPLSGILGGISNMKSKDEEQKKQIQMLEYSANHLLDVVNEILDYTKLEQKKLILDYEKVLVKKEIEEIVEANRLLIANKKIEYIINFDIDEQAEAWLDIYRLKQVLNNLIGNAIKFTKEGYVKVNVILENNQSNFSQLKIVIEDTGIGISTEKLESIFNPFSQETSKIAKQFGGTGLGLSISRQIIELFGGDLKIHSQIGKGSVFELFIPLMERTSTKTDRVFEFTIDEIKIFNQKNKVRCLVVDDNVINLELMKKFLEGFSLDIELCEDSEDALERIKKNKYDIIFLDYLMPKMSGDQLAEFIRNNSFSMGTFVVGISANEFDFESNVTPGDINKFVSKPINRKQLLKVFQEFIGFSRSGLS